MLKSLLTLLKYCCPILLLVVPCTAVIGILTPWPVATEAMGPGWAHQSVLIGMSYKYRVSGTKSFERRTQSYIGLPSSQHAFRTVRVTQENGVVRTEEDPHGLLSLLATYAVLAVGAWWFWIRPRKERSSAPQ